MRGELRESPGTYTRLRLAANPGRGVIGVTKVGRYRVRAVTAERPLTREELLQPVSARAGDAGIRARLQVEIVVAE